jgi:hypothetical protein
LCQPTSGLDTFNADLLVHILMQPAQNHGTMMMMMMMTMMMMMMMMMMIMMTMMMMLTSGLLWQPTSGLDTFNADLLVHILMQLAQNHGTAVVMTIHQPRENIFYRSVP